MPKKKSYRVIIVPETHWDRAWYMPFEQFRIRLVRLIERLLVTLRRDPDFRSFTLDGQTVVVEDYLQIRPDRRQDLEKMVRNRRLLIGPWYVLPDEFLVSAESLIRNLLEGDRIASGLGHRMKVGYVPDPFGHVGQLPQILRGFGLDSFIFARGLPRSEKVSMEFNWKAPDGSSVLAVHQRFWYNNAAFLGYPIEWGDTENLRFDMTLAIEQIRECVENLMRGTSGRTLLLNNGVDHSEHQPELPIIIAEARRRFPDWDISIGSYEDYMAIINKDLQGKRISTYQGELTYRYGDLLTGVYSARMYLKQANHSCETALERYVEPLEALCRIAGKHDDTQAFVDYAWRELMKNHPHDDICGCSIDAVHRDMMDRFRRVEQIAVTLTRENLRRLAHRMDHSRVPGIPHVLYNPTGFVRSGVQQFKIYLDPGERKQFDQFQLIDTTGKPIPFCVLKRESESWMECLKQFKTESVEVAAQLTDLPAFGVTTTYVQPGRSATAEPEDPVVATDNSLENRYVKITVTQDGSLAIHDKQTGSAYTGIGVFEDQEDAGDEYNWSPLGEPQVFLSNASEATVALLHSSPLWATLCVRQQLRVPVSLSPDRNRRSGRMVSIPITTDITVRSKTPRIDITTAVDNRARDHRLRVLFPTGIRTDHVSVDGHFDVIRRPIAPPPETVWLDKPMPPYPTEHQKGFVDVSDGKRGLAVLNVGLPEYEAIPAPEGVTVALTLFRSVGWLSRRDLLTRPASCGPEIETPAAQCQGILTFRYALYPHRGDWVEGDVLAQARELSQPISVQRADWHGGSRVDDPDHSRSKSVPREGPLPDRLSVIEVEPRSLVLSAFKNSTRGRGTICRFYNPTRQTVSATIRFGLPVSSVREVSLDERPVRGGMHVTGRQVLRMRVKPKRIVTLSVQFKRRML